MKAWNCALCGKEMHEGDKAWQSPVTHHITGAGVHSTVDYQCDDCYLQRLELRVLHLLSSEDRHKGYVSAVTLTRNETGWSLQEAADWVRKIRAEALT